MGRKTKIQEFNLDDVLKLGGTSEDFETLKDLQDGSLAKTTKIKDSLKDEEFKSFFKSVGFDNVDANLDEDSDDQSPSIFLTSSTKKTSKVVSSKVSTERDMPLPNLKSNKVIVLPSSSKTDEGSERFASRKKKERTKIASKPKVILQKTDIAPLQDDLISCTADVVSTPAIPLKSELPVKVFDHILDLASVLPTKLIIKPAGPWHANDISKMRASKIPLESNDSMVRQLRTIGSKLLENEANFYKNRKNKPESGNETWMNTVITSGTLSDKVAAYTLMLQNGPVHNYWCLDTFLAMLKKKGKREAIIGLEALRDIFLSDLLPDFRRLRFFHNQPLESLKEVFDEQEDGASTKRLEIQRCLILWTYEDGLKNLYKQLVESLRDFFLQDALDNVKSKGMKVALELLTSKPEQERELLTMLVNKLGDPKYKIASKGLHMLHCLIQEHPVMQGIVVNAVRDLLLRPNIQPKCQYYCICFLSSQILSHDRKDVADSLIQIYLGFFKAAVNKKQVDNKLLSALLTGVNRAYPFANTDDAKIMEELNVLFRTVHVSSFGTTVQALMLLFQVLSSRDELSDRYYNALYSSMLHHELPICTNRHSMYLNLLYRSMKADSSESRVQAFLKRLLQTCSLQLAAYTSAILVLITELVRARPSLKCFFDGKRFDSKTTSASGKNNFADDDDEEHFIDADKHDPDIDNTDNNVDDTKSEDKNEKDGEKGNSWTHLHKKSINRQSTIYDPVHRNPTFANADKTSLWELHQIRCHFHPTVVKFATEVTDVGKQNEPDRYPGDPLQDFTLMRFLDKFVYRNPKSRQQKDEGANTGESLFRRKRKSTMAETQTVAANTPEFLAKKNYNPEEVFLQRYFASRAGLAPRSEKKKKTKSEEDSDVEEVSDDEFDDFLSSTEGKAELESPYNFADAAAMGSQNKKRKLDLVEDSDEDDEADDFDDDAGAEGEIPDDEDPFSEEGMTFGDPTDEDDDEMMMGEEDLVPKQKSGKRGKKRSSTADVDAFDMMLEENMQNKFNTSGSGAVRNTDRSSAKQLNWEQKKEMKEIISRKRSQKRGGGFSNRNNNKRTKFDTKKNKKFSQKKNFQRGRHSR